MLEYPPKVALSILLNSFKGVSYRLLPMIFYAFRKCYWRGLLRSLPTSSQATMAHPFLSCAGTTNSSRDYTETEDREGFVPPLALSFPAINAKAYRFLSKKSILRWIPFYPSASKHGISLVTNGCLSWRNSKLWGFKIYSKSTIFQRRDKSRNLWIIIP